MGFEPGKAFFDYASKVDESANLKNEMFTPEGIYSSIDLVATFHVLEHITDLPTFLKDIKSVLNPDNGYLMFEVPGYDLSMEWQKYGVMDWHIAHRSYFTSSTLKM
jgi:predicted SAM-dependent methyltransferase